MSDILTFREFEKVGDQQIANENIVDSQAGMAALANGVLATYAGTRRVQQSFRSDARTLDTAASAFVTGLGFTPGYDWLLLNIDPDRQTAIVLRSLKGFTLLPSRRVRAWVRLASESASNKLDLWLRIGGREARIESVESTSLQWVSVEIDVDPIPDPKAGFGRSINLFVRNEGSAAERVYVYAVCIAEVTNGDTFQDTSASLAFDDYQPVSAAAFDVLRRNLDAFRDDRTARGMLFNRGYVRAEKQLINGGAYEEILRRAVIKAQGVTSLKVLTRHDNSFSFSAAFDVRVVIKDLNTGSTIATSAAQNIIPQDLKWLEFTFSPTSAERDIEIIVEARCTAGLNESFIIHAVAAYEGYSAYSHPGLPSVKNAEPDDDILAQTWKRSSLLLSRMYSSHTHILLNEWTENANPKGTSFLYDSDAARQNIRQDHVRFVTGGILHPSPGAKHLVGEFELIKPTEGEIIEVDYSGTTGTPTVGNRFFFQNPTGNIKGSGFLVADNGSTAWFAAASGSIAVGDTLANAGNTYTASSEDKTPSPSDNVFELRFVIMRDNWDSTGTGDPEPDVTANMIAEQVVDISDRPFGSRWTQRMKIPIGQELWNDPTLDGNGFPVIFALFAVPTIGGVEALVDYVTLANAVVYEEIPPYLQDGSE